MIKGFWPWNISFLTNVVTSSPLLHCSQQALQNIENYWYIRSSHRRCSIKKVLLKNSQNWQENTCVVSSLFFIKVSGLRPETLLKRDPDTGVFLWILQSFKKQTFYRTPLVAAASTIQILTFMNDSYKK